MAFWYIRAIAQVFAWTSPPVDAPPESARAALKRAMKQAPWLIGKPTACLAVHDRDIAGVPVRIYRPCEGELPVVAYFHGGGWVEGDLDTHDVPCRLLANEARALVVSVHYRRAPEHRFPAAIDDCSAVVRWLAASAAEVGGDPRRIAVGGESAGGHLAAVVTRRCRDLNLRAQLLVYPVVDLNRESDSYERFAKGHVLTAARMRYFIAAFVPEATQRHRPDVSPLLAEDLSGLAPTYLSSAPEDVLRDEGLAYAERLRQAGTPVELVDATGLLHGWVNMLGLPAARAEWLKAARWLGERLR